MQGGQNTVGSESRGGSEFHPWDDLFYADREADTLLDRATQRPRTGQTRVMGGASSIEVSTRSALTSASSSIGDMRPMTAVSGAGYQSSNRGTFCAILYLATSNTKLIL